MIVRIPKRPKKQTDRNRMKAHEVAPEQAEELKRLLEMHAQATNSRKAAAILEDFDLWLPRFRAVISDEYLRYLKEG